MLSTVLLLPLAISAFTGVARAQGKELGSFSIYTGDGFLFVRNANGKSFSMEIKGATKALKGGPNPAFDLGGKTLQVAIVPFSNFTARVTEGTDVLDLHKTWESSYLKTEIFQEELKIESEKITLGDRKALFWGFKRPKYLVEYDRDYFLATAVGEQIISISSPIKPAESVADYKKLFSAVFSTIKVSDEPFDIGKIADEIRKGTYKGS